MSKKSVHKITFPIKEKKELYTIYTRSGKIMIEAASVEEANEKARKLKL